MKELLPLLEIASSHVDEFDIIIVSILNDGFSPTKKKINATHHH